MSITSTARALRSGAPGRPGAPARHERAQARLQVVTPPPAPRSTLPFALACTALLAASLIGLLVLNISLSRGAYEVHSLRQQAALLQEREQALGEQLAASAAPAQLSQQARALGMVPGTSPAFLRLSDGTVLGQPQPAPTSAAPGVLVGARAVPSTAAPEPAAAPPVDTREPEVAASAAPSPADSVAGTEPGTTDSSAEAPAPAVEQPTGDGAVLVRP